jgi:hypothetical protein
VAHVNDPAFDAFLKDKGVSQEEIDDLRQQVLAEPGRRGVFDPNTGTMFVFAAGLTNEPGEDAPYVAVHEYVGHMATEKALRNGLDAVLGQRDADRYFSWLAMARNKEIRAYLKERGAEAKDEET